MALISKLSKIILYFRNRYLTRGSFTTNVLTLITGNTLANTINILTMPLLTRIYSPEDFGIATIFVSLAGTVSLLAAFRYEVAIVLPSNEKDAVALLQLSVLITILISFLVLLVFLLIGDNIAVLLNSPQLGTWLKLAPLSILSTSFYSIFSYWFNRKKNYSILSQAKFLQASATFISQLSFYYLFPKVLGGIIIGQLLGQMVSSLLLLLSLGKFPSIKIIQWSQLWAVAKQYSKFPRYSSLGIALDGVASGLPALTVSSIFSSKEAGFYGLAERLLFIPWALMGTSISQVFYQKMAEHRINNRETKLLVLKTWKFLFLTGLLPVLIILLYGNNLFVLLLGKDWEMAGRFSQILAVAILPQWVASTTSIGVVALNRLDLLLKWQLVYFLSTIVICITGYAIENLLSMLWMLSLSRVIVYLLYMYFLLKAVDEPKLIP